MLDKDCCPICGYKFDMCQCRFSGSAHPNRALTDKALKIVMTRLKELEKSDENENI